MKWSLAIAIFVAALIGASTASAQMSQFAGSPNSPASRVPNEAPGRGQLTIALRVYDFAHLDPPLLQSAERVASEIFRRTGITTAWLNCPLSEQCVAETEGPQFNLEIVPNINRAANEDTLGFALPCHKADRVCVSYFLYSAISALAARHVTDPSRLLGHVIAHEIGHALLGPNAHDLHGIMQHKLPIAETERGLYFTPFQAKQLRANLLVRESELQR